MNEKGVVLQTFKLAVVSIQDEHGMHEQDVELIFKSVLNLLKQSLAVVNETDILCISFSAAMHSLIAVDTTGKPLTNAVTWADTRSKVYARQLRETKEGRAIYTYTGTPIHAMSPLCKLLWLRKEMPGIFNNAAKFISIKEYIFFKLFGKYIVDEGIASATGMYNIYDYKWHEQSLKLTGIDVSKLSTVVAATHIETILLPEIRNELQLKTNIPFVAGGNDGCLANLGCGALSNNIAVLTVGTSGAVRLTVPPPLDGKQEILNERNGLFRYLLTKEIAVIGGPINNGGIVLQWFAGNFLQFSLPENNNLQKLTQMAATVNPGADDLLFLPYLLGERAPVWDEDAAGMFYGLRISHKKEHLTRAVIEGISFSLLQILKETE
ncbi:MAG TPA: gluconokinase, partial [Panacibacter sp.]|nr:gluconokinase [Panacibacter sp.]